MKSQQQLVVVGGGFGGLHAVKALVHAPVDIILIDKRNFHLFQPLLYQVATGGLSPANIAAPLRSVFKRQRNVNTVLGTVTGIDVKRRCVLLHEAEIGYDRLIVASGAENSYFGHPGWAALAPGLKTVEDATRIRARVLSAFEHAERCTDPLRLRELLTFVVIGGGPTGIELAGAISEIARHTLLHDFRRINPADARVLLVEGNASILKDFPRHLVDQALRGLDRLGIELQLNTRVTAVTPDGVVLQRAGEHAECGIRAHTLVWAAGVQASGLGCALAQATGCGLDHGGRVLVAPDLTLPGYPEIFVIGDLAHVVGRDGRPLPCIAPVAIQQGRYVAQRIREGTGAPGAPQFCYRNYGSMVTIGRAMAVADLGRLQLSGLAGWLAWLFIHLLYLVGFDNRMLVLLQWCWYYVTWNRAARLITETDQGAGGAPAECHADDS